MIVIGKTGGDKPRPYEGIRGFFVQTLINQISERNRWRKTRRKNMRNPG
jgi:hypothetical protein